MFNEINLFHMVVSTVVIILFSFAIMTFVVLPVQMIFNHFNPIRHSFDKSGQLLIEYYFPGGKHQSSHYVTYHYKKIDDKYVEIKNYKQALQIFAIIAGLNIFICVVCAFSNENNGNIFEWIITGLFGTILCSIMMESYDLILGGYRRFLINRYIKNNIYLRSSMD